LRGWGDRAPWDQWHPETPRDTGKHRVWGSHGATRMVVNPGGKGSHLARAHPGARIRPEAALTRPRARSDGFTHPALAATDALLLDPSRAWRRSAPNAPCFFEGGRCVLGLADAWAMRCGRAAAVSFGCFLSIAGCGNSDGDGGSNAGVDWSNLNPPPNIDITSCFDVQYDGSDGFSSSCSSCCQTAGFSASSSLNDDHCTCGEAPADDRDTVCAAEASEPTAAPCTSCCTAAGFSGSTWVGGGDSGRCSCHGTRNSEICAGSLAGAVPDEACFYCCLEHGYLSAGYTNFGSRECTCIAP